MSWKGPLEETIRHEWREVQQVGGCLPAIRTGAASCLHDGNIYLFCGFGAGVGRSADVWRFNIASGMWNTVKTLGNNSDKPNKRDGHSVTDIGEGKVLLFGGQGDPSVNEKSERTLDIVKTKTWVVRDLYNDLFQYDCTTDTFEMLCPEGGVPLCRRGHSAIYFPKGGYKERQLNIPHVHQAHVAHASTSSPKKSPKKKKGVAEEIIDVFDPIPENSLIMFGGSGMEVSKYIEAVYNDLWVYSLDTGRWNKTKTRGIEPRPLFDHRALRIGHIMLVVGGITATNAKAATTGNELSENHEVMMLNLKTLIWSHIEIITSDGKPAKLNLHGHSLEMDPHEDGLVYLFGGKDTVDGKMASLETSQGAKKYFKKQAHDCHAWVIDIQSGVMSPLPAINSAPVNRYEHLTQLHASEGVVAERPPPPKRKAGVRIEPLFYIFGGAQNELQGLCDPIMYSFVRTYTYTNPELMSIGGGGGAASVAGGTQGGAAAGNQDQEVVDDNTISTVHTADASSIYTAQEQAGFEESDGLKQPSIWEKKQLFDIAAGKTNSARNPSSWKELKLALSSSFTDKRSCHVAPNPGLGSPTRDGGGTGTLPPTSSAPESKTLAADDAAQSKGGVDSAASSTGLSAKQKQKKEIARLRALGSQVLPLVKGKCYKDAKQTYFEKFPAPMPALRTYKGSMAMSKSMSQSLTQQASQSKMI